DAFRDLTRRWRVWKKRQRLHWRGKGSQPVDSKINLLHTDDSDSESTAASPRDEEVSEGGGGVDALSSALYPSHASRIGQLLSDYTAHRVVLGVLFVLILYNLFHPHSLTTIHPYAIHHLNAMMDGAMNSSTSILEH